jgi:hypothetical protein
METPYTYHSSDVIIVGFSPFVSLGESFGSFDCPFMSLHKDFDYSACFFVPLSLYNICNIICRVIKTPV